MPCELCEMINGNFSAVEQHQKLQMTSSVNHIGVMARGRIEHFKCIDCEALLSRDKIKLIHMPIGQSTKKIFNNISHTGQRV